MSFDVVVVGSVNRDSVARAERLPRPGESVEGDRFLEGPGGKGGNQAVAAARLGARTALIARLGRDERGDTLLERLRAEGLGLDHVTRDETEPTGAALVIVGPDGEKQLVAALGANRRLSADDVRAAGDVIRQAGVLLVQLEVPPDTVLEASRLAADAGVPVILDPAPPRTVPDELLARLAVIRPNAHEAEALTGVEVRTRESAGIAAERLLERGARAAVVQAGDAGNLLRHAGGELFLPRVPVRGVDATGAGDALAGALAARLAAGDSLERATRFAHAAAALATTGFGAQDPLPRRGAVQALLEEMPEGKEGNDSG